MHGCSVDLETPPVDLPLASLPKLQNFLSVDNDNTLLERYLGGRGSVKRHSIASSSNVMVGGGGGSLGAGSTPGTGQLVSGFFLKQSVYSPNSCLSLCRLPFCESLTSKMLEMI